MSLTRALLYALIGAVLWFIAAIFIKLAGPVLLDNGLIHAILYVLTVASFPPIVWAIAKTTQTPTNAMLVPTVIAVVAATFLDGIAITWFSELYGGPGHNLSMGSGWLLWGVGSALFSALVMSKQNSTGENAV